MFPLRKLAKFAFLRSENYNRDMNNEQKKYLKRHYLNELIDLIGTPDIKVITGVRRCGKSVLLKELSEYISQNASHANIISINFTDLENEKLKNYPELNRYIESCYQPGYHNFVLIDEVQMCEGFEHTINSLHASGKYDLYITGSNAFLLSSDLATLFTGRTFTIEVFPFSFCEFIEYYQLEDIQTALDRYILEGGLSGSYAYKTLEQKYHYIDEVYNALIVRDIEHKYEIKNRSLLDNVSDFMMDNISNLTSYRKVAQTLSSNGVDTNDKTVGNYIKYLCDAYAFYQVKRYDVQGKKYLSSQDKFYLSDHAFKFARLGTKNINYGRIYENIVAIELLRRGYEVYVGTLRNAEVDFVAINRQRKMYLQVSQYIDNEETFKREVAPLLEVKDAYPKILLSRTKQPMYDYEGIHIIDIADWLSRDPNKLAPLD